MKKKVISVLLAATMTIGLLTACSSNAGSGTSGGGEASTAAQEAQSSSSDEASTAAQEAQSSDSSTDTSEQEAPSSGGGTYALVTKSAGNPYMERMGSGFEEVVQAAGGTAIIQNPEAITADAQISVINSLISQGVDSICIAANDENALQAVLQQAMDAGIKVSCLDAKVNATSRMTFINQAGIVEVGQALMDAVHDISGGSGQFAILSATSQAANQNAWIEAMQKIMEEDSKYADLELVEVAYGDDEPQKSTDQTQALLTNYPDLKVICAPTTVGIAAAAKVLQDQGSAVKLTGLGLPSEMAEYIGDDEAHSCPYMFLWNPIDLGRLGAYTSIALADGTITGAEGETFTAGDFGEYTIVAADDGGTEIILGPPFKFDPSNIEDWKSVY